MTRKTAALCVLFCGLVLAISAEAAGPNPQKPDYVIREGFFVGMMADIFMEFSRYEGKVIQYEGFVLPITAEDFGEGPEKFAVVRTVICCGPDDMPIGFACFWAETPPPENAWVRVTGVLRSREHASIEEPGETESYPYLDVTSLEILKKRGKEKVGQ